jgi:hypothetical protein
VTTTKKDAAFARVPLRFAIAAARATKTPAALVWVYLVHASWKANSLTFPLPNGWLKEHGASREIKRRVLRDLERAGLIAVDRPPKKSPIVTLLVP